MNHFKLPQCLRTKSKFYISFPYKWMLSKIRLEFVEYFKRFACVLEKHSESEFEVQIRSKEITENGKKMLDMLENDFEYLQYHEKITLIVSAHKTQRFLSKRIICDLLDVVCEELIHHVSMYVNYQNKRTLILRRKKNNKLCAEKNSTGPMVMNFTGLEIPIELIEHLKTGLKNVPYLSVNKDTLYNELTEEAILCCKERFRLQYNRYPFVSSKSTFDEKILSIISQCVTNTEIVRNLSDFRNCFVESLPAYLSSLPKGGLDIGSLLSLMPEGSVITTSDKNVGISILPYEWYIKEYETQMEKGGHENVNISEDECSRHL